MRRAGPADAGAVRALTRAVYARWIPLIEREPRPMFADYAAAIRAHWIDLLEDETGLVALIELIPMADHLLIENIAVCAGRQRLGLGSLLISHAEAVARDNRLIEIRLYTNAAFTSNLTFYLARGFVETGRTPLPDDGTSVHFAKPVS